MTERKTMTIYAEPTRQEIINWAQSALRNSDIDHIDDDLISDFKDGLSALAVATGQLVPAQKVNRITERAALMMEVAARYIRENDLIYDTVDYDETTCDGACVADDLENAALELRVRFPAAPVEGAEG